MLENTESCDMRRVDRDWSSWDQDGDPCVGDFQIVERDVPVAGSPWEHPRANEPTARMRLMYMMLPGHSFCCIPIRPIPDAGKNVNSGASWEWDGNEEAPTLTPSVHQIGHWHGFIRAGRMVSC